jgi:RimJ/RimL family protein N-acetyltransferase
MTERTNIVVREATPADARYMDSGFERLSATSRYYRFFSMMPRLPAALRRQLTDLDGAHHAAVIAFDPAAADGPDGLPVGVARWIHDSDGVAHLAMAVVDDYQRRGIGRILLDQLMAMAHERGIASIHADVLSDNTAMHRLLAAMGAKRVASGDPSIASYTLATSPSGGQAAPEQ